MGPIVEASIAELHGRYSYHLAIPKGAPPDESSLMVLYGGNGSGKSTILRVLFHLLSFEGSSGHRSYLAQLQFERVRVRFTDGSSLQASRPEPNRGDYDLSFETAEGVTASCAVEADPTYRVSSRSALRTMSALRTKRARPDTLDTFLEQVRQEFPLNVYLLTDSRRLYADALGAVDRDYKELDSRSDTVLRRHEGHEAPSPSDPVRLAMRQAHETILQRYSIAQAGSNVSMHEIYRTLLAGLGGAFEPPKSASQPTPVTKLYERLQLAAKREEDSRRFGLGEDVDYRDILQDVQQTSEVNEQVARQILSPYVDAIEARQKALEPIVTNVSTLLRYLNRYLWDKAVDFSLRQGFQVVGGSGERLDASQLSSGERQLLLLLLSTLHARDESSILLIDEPELSLNTTWLRSLIRALEELTAGSPTQFILATHSFDLIAGHDANMVKLEPQLSGQIPFVEATADE